MKTALVSGSSAEPGDWRVVGIWGREQQLCGPLQGKGWTWVWIRLQRVLRPDSPTMTQEQ